MKSAPAFLTLLLALAWLPTVNASVKEAQSLQDKAVQRIDRYVTHFRQTFDRNSLRHELTQSERELEDSVRLFLQAGALEEAGRSLVKLGDSRRYLDQWDSAISAYEQAARTARKAGAGAVLCKALLGRARALLYGKKTSGPALELVEQALPLAKELDNRSYFFETWDLLAQIQVSQGDLVGAADSMSRAFFIENAIKDDELLFYAYLDRAEIYQKFAEKCDYQRDFKPCLDEVERAFRDYEQALTLARKLRWHGLAEQTQGFIQRLKIRKEMIQGQQRVHELMTDTDIFSPRTAADVVISEIISPAIILS